MPGTIKANEDLFGRYLDLARCVPVGLHNNLLGVQSVSEKLGHLVAY